MITYHLISHKMSSNKVDILMPSVTVLEKSKTFVAQLILGIISQISASLQKQDKCQLSSDEQQTTRFTVAAQKYHEACNTLTTITWARNWTIGNTTKASIDRLTELRKSNAPYIAAETKCVETLKLLLDALVQFLDWLASNQMTIDTSVKQYTQKKLEQLKAFADNKEKCLARNIDLSNALEKLIAFTQQSSQEVQKHPIIGAADKEKLRVITIGKSNALERFIEFAQQLSLEVQDDALALFAAAIDAAKGEQFDTLHQEREEANERIETISAEIVQAQQTVNKLSIDLGKYQEAVKSASDEMDKIYDVRDNSKLCPYDPYNLCGNRRECCNVKIAACNKMTAAAKLVEKKKTQITEAKETLFYANRRYEAAKQALVTVEQQISDAEQKFNDAEKRIRDFCKNDVSAPQ